MDAHGGPMDQRYSRAEEGPNEPVILIKIPNCKEI